MINEGIIPMNLNWRAGNQIQNGYEINGTGRNAYVKQIPNKGELYNSLAGEIDLQIKNFTDNRPNNISETEKIIIKTSIENKIKERFGGYQKYLDVDFYQYLNNYINLQEYNGIIDQQFINNCLNNIINPTKNIYKQENQSGYIINE